MNFLLNNIHKAGLLGGSDSKESTCNAGYRDSIPGSGRPPVVGNSNPLQYSCLESHGRPWGHKGSDTTEWLTLSLSTYLKQEWVTNSLILMEHSTFFEYFHTRMILMEAHCSAAANRKQHRKEMAGRIWGKTKGNIMRGKLKTQIM